MRLQKLIKNGLTGVILQFVTIALAFISRKLFLHYLGIEYTGANGLFTNVLSLLSLSELGFSSAIIYHLYKPLKDNDHRTVAALMNFYKDIYRLVALFIAVAGSLLSLFVPFFTRDTSFSDSFLRIIYFCFLFQTVSSYFFSYKFSIISAQQDNYRFFWVDFTFQFVLVGVNLLNICLTHNYLAYLAGGIAINLLTNIIKSCIVDRQYPFLHQKEKLGKEERKNIFADVKNIFIGQLSTKILNSTDNLVISSFLGLTTVGMYDNYSSIQSRVMNMINSMTRSLPNALSSTAVTESKIHTNAVLKKTTEVLFIIASFSSVSLFCLSTKFVCLWYGAEYELAVIIVFLLSFSFFMQIVKTPLWYVLMGTGLFSRDKYISLIGAISNLVISILLVMWIGLPGVIIGTIISQGIQMILKNRLLFKSFFHESQFPFLGVMLKGFLVFGFEMAVSYFLCIVLGKLNLTPIVDFLICILICLFIPNIISWLFYHKSEGYEYVLTTIKKTLLKRKKEHV